MATDNRSLPSFFSSDADFRAWGGGTNAALAAIGLVQTADTGQINWTTAVRPGGYGTAGHEVWRFDDALQATAPVFFRLDYGCGPGNSCPKLQVQVGQGSDGAGNLTGSVSAQVGAWTPNSSDSAGQMRDSLCSGHASALRLLYCFDSSDTNTSGLLIERVCDPATGTETDEGVVMMTAAYNGVCFQLVPTTGTVPTQLGPWPIVGISTGSTSHAGSDVAMMPVLFAANGKPRTVLGALGYKAADIGVVAGTTISVTHLGAAHDFQPAGKPGSPSTAYAQGDNASSAIALAFE